MVKTRTQEMIQWARTWADFFAPYIADDNDWYRDGQRIDGKDAGDLGAGLAEVARLLAVAQERIAALCPPVTPLTLGERVTIDDADAPSMAWLEGHRAGDVLR